MWHLLLGSSDFYGRTLHAPKLLRGLQSLCGSGGMTSLGFLGRLAGA